MSLKGLIQASRLQWYCTDCGSIVKKGVMCKRCQDE